MPSYLSSSFCTLRRETATLQVDFSRFLYLFLFLQRFLSAFLFFFFFFSPILLSPLDRRWFQQKAGGAKGEAGGKKKLLSRSGFHLSLSLPPPLLPCAARRGGMNAEPVSSELQAGKREENSRALGMETRFCSEGWLLSLCVCVLWLSFPCLPKYLPPAFALPSCLAGWAGAACVSGGCSLCNASAGGRRPGVCFTLLAMCGGVRVGRRMEGGGK